MEVTFDRNTKMVEEIYNDFSKGRLIVDASYQRRKVWLEQDKVRLVETILLGFVIPEVFFWPSNIDPDTGAMLIHIVDGQQRINAISEYIAGDFKLSKKYLLNEKVSLDFGDKYFSELDSETKRTIWSYKISVVIINRICTKEEIAQMFYRLNLTNYSLNSQEKLNSINSAFGDKAEMLSGLDFWKVSKVFSSTDARRMKDVEYCCSIYILANEGITDQTNDKKIKDYYEDYKEKFDDDEALLKKIYEAIEIIKQLTDKTTIQFVSKKAQMYTLFCLAFQMIDKGIPYSEDLFEKFKLFVEAYNNFRNEFTIVFDDANMSEVYENIKRYKLASSEGINKIGNRVIRFQMIYKICIESKEDIKNVLKDLNKAFIDLLEAKMTSYDNFEKDDLVDINF